MNNKITQKHSWFRYA